MQSVASVRNWAAAVVDGWNRFWFTPADPATLGAIRIFAGAMLFYTHLVWSLDLRAFLGRAAGCRPRPCTWSSRAATPGATGGGSIRPGPNGSYTSRRWSCSPC